MLRDDLAREAFRRKKSTVVPWVLMASYAYYILSESLLEDGTFDKMCKYLYDNWDSIEHRHKNLFTREDMSSGSLFMLKADDYPLIVQVTVGQFLREDRVNERQKIVAEYSE